MSPEGGDVSDLRGPSGPSGRSGPGGRRGPVGRAEPVEPTDRRGRAPVSVTPCPDGPLLVRGADEVRDEYGDVHPVTRPVVALCRCDKSQRMPWCDGTHHALARARANREARN